MAAAAGAPAGATAPEEVAGVSAVAPGLAEASPDVRKEILLRIGDQVTQLLLQAKKDSESKVKAELKVLNDVMVQMDGRLDGLVQKLDELEDGPKQVVEMQTVAQALAKLEQQWGKELGKLKQELHQTIFAHNHNADLMKHQKDALDTIRNELEAQKSPASDRVKLAKAQLAKADTMLKGQQKQRNLDPLFRRLLAIEQKISALRWPPMGMMPPMAGMPPPMGMPGMPRMPGMPGMGMPPGMPGMQPPGLQMAAAAAGGAGAASGRMPSAAAAAAWAKAAAQAEGARAAAGAEGALAAADSEIAEVEGEGEDDEEADGS